MDSLNVPTKTQTKKNNKGTVNKTARIIGKSFTPGPKYQKTLRKEWSARRA